MAFASGSTPNPGHCETVFDGIFRSVKEWTSRRRHKPSCEKDFSPNVLQLISKLDEAIQLCQKNVHARKKLRKKSKQIRSVLMKLEKTIADPKVTNHKEISGKKQASSGHQEGSQSHKDEQQVQSDQSGQKCQQVDDFVVLCEPEDGVDLSELVIAEESTAVFAGKGTIGDCEHEHDLDSGLVDICLDSEEGTDDINHLKKIISVLKSQIIDLNNNIDTLRGHSREQSRQVLKFKQEAEVSDMKGQQLVEVERMQHEAKEECAHLHKQLEITTEELLQVRSEKQVVEKEYAQLERTLISMGSLSSQLMEARQTHSKLRQQLTEKENENAAIRSQLEMCRVNFGSERSKCVTTELEKSRTQVQDRIELERLEQRNQYEQLKHDYELTSTQLMELRESVAVMEEENNFLKQEILAKSSQVKQYAKEVDRLKKHIESTSTQPVAVPTAISPSVVKCDKSTQDDLNQRSVSPFTGQKHAKVVSDGDQLMGEFVERDCPSPHKKISSPCEDQPRPNPDVKEEHSKPSPCQLEDSITQLENPLLKKLDDEIHEEASEVIQEVNGGRFEDSLERRRPYDPNLVCPMCRKRFRIGGIQKFRRHVNTCTGTDD